jgi:hypothetical protein
MERVTKPRTYWPLTNLQIPMKPRLWPRVARWHVSISKIPFWVNFGEYCNERCWCFNGHLIYLFYGHSVCVVTVRSILGPFGIFYGYLVYFSRFGILYQEKSGNPSSGQRCECLRSKFCSILLQLPVLVRMEMAPPVLAEVQRVERQIVKIEIVDIYKNVYL